MHPSPRTPKDNIREEMTMNMQAPKPPWIPWICATVTFAFSGTSLATSNGNTTEGKQLYEDFNCASCHGADAKTGKTVKTPRLAGMNVDDIYVKTKRFIESKVHDEVIKGCGETPNHIQIKRIAEYVSTLPQ